MRFTLKDSNRLLSAISHAQAFYINESETGTMYRYLLDSFLDLTASEFGFIGQVCRREDGSPWLKTQAISNIAWNDDTRALLARQGATGLEFNQHDSLLGAAMLSGKPVIDNHPETDPRSGDRPPGPADLHAFMGLPVHVSETLVGVVAVANRKGGYQEELVKFLQPLVNCYGQLLAVSESDREWYRLQVALDNSLKHLQAVVAEREDTITNLTGFIEQLGNPVITTNSNLLITGWNQAAERVFGHRKDAAIGQAVDILFEPGEARPDFLQLAKLPGDRTTREFSVQLGHASGKSLSAHLSLTIARSREGAIDRMIFNVVDTSAERAALARLEESESRYRQLFEFSQDAIAIFENELCVDCNQAAVDMFGWGSKEATLKARLGDRSPPLQPDGADSRTLLLKHFQTCANTGYVDFDWVLRRANGEDFPAAVRLVSTEYRGARRVQVTIRDVTESKRHEEAIRLHEKYLENILDGGPISIITSDRDSGLVLGVNEPAREILGVVKDDLLQSSGLNFWTQAAERAKYLELVQRYGRASGESELVKLNGEKFSAMITCQTDPRDADALLWWVSDISAQKQMERQLQQNKEFLEKILDHLPVALFVKDVKDDFRYILNNRKSVEMFDSVGKNVLGGTDYDALDFAEANTLRAQDLEIVRTGRPFENPEEFLQHPGGESVYIRTQKVLLTDEGGIPSLILGVAENISERVEIEKALKNSEKRFRQLAAHAPVGIFLTDPRGACIYVNEKWQKMSGMNEEQAAGDGWLLALHKDDRPAASEAWHKFTHGESGFDCEYRFVTPQRKITWVSGKAVAFRNDDDQVVGFLGSTSDITDRKQFELDLQSSSEAAQRANAAKSEFLSRMSHELRTPLNAVLGFGQLLQMHNQNLTASQSEGIGHILAAGEHLLHLIDDVLDFSRIDSGHVSMSLRRVSTAQALQQSIALVATQAERQQVTIHVPAPPIPDVFVDDHRLKQVLVNLLSNAVKYNHIGGTVDIDATVLPDNVVRISITDSGLGIRPEDQARLFKPFERIADQDRVVEGTGIGLSICLKLVELMGGQIGFESTFGSGSTFWLDLPSAAIFDWRKETTSDPETRSDLAALEGIRILYIEDHRASIHLIAAIARLIKDCEFITAGNAPEGVALAKSSRPSLILMDINLPGLNGFEALKLLRNDERTVNIPVIAVSAGVLNDRVEAAKAAGFDHFLVKPFRLEELFLAMIAVSRYGLPVIRNQE